MRALAPAQSAKLLMNCAIARLCLLKFTLDCWWLLGIPEVDHIISRRRVGQENIRNLQLLCVHCN